MTNKDWKMSKKQKKAYTEKAKSYIIKERLGVLTPYMVYVDWAHEPQILESSHSSTPNTRHLGHMQATRHLDPMGYSNKNKNKSFLVKI